MAIGTVFRHFPTKEALIEAVLVERLRGFVTSAEALATAPDPGAAFFGFLSRWAEVSASKHAFADALADAGVDVSAAGREYPLVIEELRRGIELLLSRAQDAGAVRPDLRFRQLVTLMVGISHAAEHAGHDPALRAATMEIFFDGLRCGCTSG